MAQSSYLKSGARLYVTERAFERGLMLVREKVIGLAELQRREGEMRSARAERREAQARLRLLGMADDKIDQLDRDQTIHSNIPITAPFTGRIIFRNLTKGEVVEVTHRLFTIADLSTVWVLANIPEKISHSSAIPCVAMGMAMSKCGSTPIRMRYSTAR